MNQSQKNQEEPNSLHAIYVVKLQTQAALQKEAVQLDIEIGILQHKLHSQTEHINYFNNVLIPKRDKMCNDIKIAHKAWLQYFEDTRDKRQRLATLHTEKMSNLEQEEIQLKKKISDKEIEARQLQATITKLKGYKSQQQQIQNEAANIHAMTLNADKKKTKLQNSVKKKEEFVANTKLSCNRSADELQTFKQDDTDNAIPLYDTCGCEPFSAYIAIIYRVRRDQKHRKEKSTTLDYNKKHMVAIRS